MNASEKIRELSPKWERFSWVLAVVWTLVVSASLVWNVILVKQGVQETARVQARVAHGKDVIYRRWNAVHGEVYVPVTEETQPNPYLSNMPERDITMPSGKLITLMNPAYMTRQVHELAEEEYGVRGHITSLNPIRPENAPDKWETEALQAFESGEIEISSVDEMEGERYMRLMRPLITEVDCLKCHAAQGYQEGDIRGGISVSILMEPLLIIMRKHTLKLVLTHVLVWLVGLGGIVLGIQRIKQSERDRKQAEEGLKRYAEQLEQANIQLQKVDHLKSVFLATMSHELRTPLNSIIGFTGVMLQGLTGPLNPEQDKQLNMAYDSAKHLLALINDVLDISKIEAGQLEIAFEPFDMREAIEEVVRTVSPLAKKKKLNLVAAVTPEVGQIVSDRRRVEQILINLANNAIKFTEKGEVRVECQVIDDRLVTSVVDTGIGIKPEDIDKIFEAFRQVETGITRQHEGTGLGLSICQKLVEMLGGEIWAESEWGVESTFTFTLPNGLSLRGAQ